MKTLVMGFPQEEVGKNTWLRNDQFQQKIFEERIHCVAWLWYPIRFEFLNESSLLILKIHPIKRIILNSTVLERWYGTHTNVCLGHSFFSSPILLDLWTSWLILISHSISFVALTLQIPPVKLFMKNPCPRNFLKEGGEKKRLWAKFLCSGFTHGSAIRDNSWQVLRIIWRGGYWTQIVYVPSSHPTCWSIFLVPRNFIFVQHHYEI